MRESSPLDPRPSRGSQSSGDAPAKGPMEYIPEGESLMISACKLAVGMDTYEGAFAIHMRHIEKELDQRVDNKGNLLNVSIVMFGIGLSTLAAGIIANL